jgi:uncharacterized protein YyaL (SSP411 family)
MSLDHATSPYLLAHKDNPIQWRAWGPDVLAEAKAQDKPVLLSLGYVGCHWCQVMNREAFSDPATANFINENYIPALADRDERPDVDMLYQGAAGLMGHQGGWPLNIFLTPEGEPFWVAGYLALTDMADAPSFHRLVTETAALWQNDRARALDTGGKVRAAVENLYNRDMTEQEGLNLDLASVRLAQRYDIFFGGLQGALKFPNALLLQVLWRAFLRTGTPQFSQVIFTTLDNLLFGGGYDHVGGGFFRHTLDERWFEPSFEKMLYDQALMIDLCTQIWQFNRNELSRQRVAETVNFLMRDMKAGDAFAASISSGSQTEDGKYYTWSEAEIDAGLVGTFSARFKQVYGITRDGNMLGRNLPRRLGNPAPANDADEALLARQREMLLAIREKRAKPLRDDRVLTDWNGLAIAALARAGKVFERPEWVEAAVRAFDSVVRIMGTEGNILSHVQGSAGIAEDYADMARAALQLREVTGDNRFLELAKAWTQVLNVHFWNERINGYCFYADNAEPLFVRPRMVFDNPTPSANGTMLTVLTQLALLTGETDYMNRASTLGNTFANEANRMLNGAGGYLAGIEYLINSLQVLVIGHKGHSRTQDLVRAYWSKPMPSAMLVQLEPGDPLPVGHPATGRGMEGGHPTAYICQQGNCSNAITDAGELSLTLTLPPQLRAQQIQQLQQSQQPQQQPQSMRF